MSAASSSLSERAEQIERDQKNWSTMVARAALKGFQLWRTDAADGEQRFIIAKWGMTRVLADLPEVERFFEQAGAPA